MSYESPAVHPTISPEERKYIEDAIGETAGLVNPLQVCLCPNKVKYTFSHFHAIFPISLLFKKIQGATP